MFRVGVWALGGEGLVRVDKILKFRSLGWWSDNSRDKGAMHGKPVHARSGPRKRWETYLHRYACSIGSFWMELCAAPDALKHCDAFASGMVP